MGVDRTAAGVPWCRRVVVGLLVVVVPVRRWGQDRRWAVVAVRRWGRTVALVARRTIALVVGGGGGRVGGRRAASPVPRWGRTVVGHVMACGE